MSYIATAEPSEVIKDSPIYKARERKLKSLVRMFSNYFRTKELYIAGGQIRDLLLEREPADIDVFLPLPEGFDEELLLPLVSGLTGISNVKEIVPEKNCENLLKRGDGTRSYPGNLIVFDSILNSSFQNYSPNDLLNLWNTDEQVQFIFTKDVSPKYYITNEMCCNLSKAWIGPDGNIAVSADFARGVWNKQLRFDWTWNNYHANWAYVNKMIEKFPDYEINSSTQEGLNLWRKKQHEGAGINRE